MIFAVRKFCTQNIWPGSSFICAKRSKQLAGVMVDGLDQGLSIFTSLFAVMFRIQEFRDTRVSGK